MSTVDIEQHAASLGSSQLASTVAAAAAPAVQMEWQREGNQVGG